MLAIALENLYCHSPREVQGRTVPVDELNVDEMEDCGEYHNTLKLYMPIFVQDEIFKWRYTMSCFFIVEPV